MVPSTKDAMLGDSIDFWSSTSVLTEPSAVISIWPESTMLISAVARTARAVCALASPASKGAPPPTASARARNRGERILAGSLVMNTERTPIGAATAARSRQPVGARVRRGVGVVTTREPLLQLLPPLRIEQVPEMLAHRGQFSGWQAHERAEALREDIARAYMEPRLLGHCLFRAARLRPGAEHAVADQAQLVI
ncbi:hypothetical protein G6F68_015054 [Rhizopus microsporus]|nr:hypothetical protein G6F68_015054 [Rhizopus microsporus]